MYVCYRQQKAKGTCQVSHGGGFEVIQLDMSAERSQFLCVVKRALKHLNGWNHQRTMKWVRKWDDELCCRSQSGLHHYGPIDLICSHLADKRTKTKLGSQHSYYHTSARRILREVDGSLPSARSATAFDFEVIVIRRRDWAAIKERIKSEERRFVQIEKAKTDTTYCLTEVSRPDVALHP